jgi:glycosyltransferase involved in cell wall biosynthesis
MPYHQQVVQMKLAFLVSHSDPGGVQQIWANLAERFREQSHDVRLIALYPFGQTSAQNAELPFTYIVPERPKGLMAAPRMMAALARTLRQEKFDVIFTAMPAANVIVPIMARLASASTKVILSHHTPVDTYSRIFRLMEGPAGLLRNVSHIVTVSRAVAQSLRQRPGAYRRKIKVIHNALPARIEEKLSEMHERRLSRQENDRIVIATGRLAYQKNYPTIIHTAALVPGVKFQIVGSGPEEQSLKAMARAQGVEDRVIFLGQKSRAETLSLLAQADIFFQPSLFEGHSLALIEAAKIGLPLVVSDVPVQIEGITSPTGARCGIAAQAEDAPGFAVAITGLLNDPAIYRQAQNSAAELGKTITFERMYSAYLDLALEATGKRLMNEAGAESVKQETETARQTPESGS